MKTKVLMAGSALIMGIAGLAGTFAPQDVGQALSLSGQAESLSYIYIQLLAALLLGFAIANWTAKDSLIGGIYNRPLALGNLMHFVVGAFALGRFAFAHAALPFAIAAVIYAVFAIGFGLLVFGGVKIPAAAAAIALVLLAPIARADCNAADRAWDDVRTWYEVRLWFEKYAPACDDGSIAEGLSDKIVVRLAWQWESVAQLRKELDGHRAFRKFVLRHIDSTTNYDDLRKLRDNAKHRCPDGEAALCKAIVVQTDRALADTGGY